MAEVVLKGIESYVDKNLPRRPDVFHEMEQRAREEDFPIIGPQVGQFLKMLTETMGAKRVFELGSGYGYSAMWFALGLPNDGEIVLTDHDDQKLRDAGRYLSRLWLNGKAEYKSGNALDYFKQAKGEWDIVFCDIDKEDYPEIVDLAHDKLRMGGFLITDNALWYGKVLEKEQDKATKAVDEYNRKIAEHDGFENVILSVRDGVSLARKVVKDESLWLPSA